MTTSPVAEFFDAEANAYSDKHFRSNVRTFIGVRQERILDIVDALGLPPAASILDAGCGPGLLSAELARRGFAVTSLDFSAGMLATTARGQQHLPAHARSRPVRGDVERLPLRDGAFDLVCSAGVIEYLLGDERTLREFARVLRPGGFLVVSTTRAGAPVHLLEPLIEGLKRQPAVQRGLGLWCAWRGHPLVQPRHFRVRAHRPAEFRGHLRAAGLHVIDDRFFYFTPWPHPADRFLPGVSSRSERRLARSRSPLIQWLAAGYIALARRLG